MPRARATAVIDTSCLLSLMHLDLLASLTLLYATIYVPRHVIREASRRGQSRYPVRSHLKHYSFLERCSVGDEVGVRLLYDVDLDPNASIDQGEAEVIIQGRERAATEVLIDEPAGRGVAQNYDLRVKGTLGILMELKRIGVIKEVGPLIEKLIVDLGFRMNRKLLAQELEQIGEA